MTSQSSLEPFRLLVTQLVYRRRHARQPTGCEECTRSVRDGFGGGRCGGAELQGSGVRGLRQHVEGVDSVRQTRCRGRAHTVGEGWFCRGALRGRSPCTREGRRPDRPKYNNEGRKIPLLASFRFANQLRLSSYPKSIDLLEPIITAYLIGAAPKYINPLYFFRAGFCGGQTGPRMG